MANVNLPEQLYSDLEKIVQDSKEFADVSAYVSYILQQVVEKKKQQAGNTVAPVSVSSYSKDDEDKIRERLKNLGYLD
jgi:Arc/MetJ-type ribon-helix-helix transcriptional regulator